MGVPGLLKALSDAPAPNLSDLELWVQKTPYISTLDCWGLSVGNASCSLMKADGKQCSRRFCI